MRGLIHLYCGDGKGKTTCAMGLGLRAVGADKKVFMLQFLKSDNCSEHRAIRQLQGFDYRTVMEFTKFVFQMSDAEKEDVKTKSEEAFDEVCEMCRRGEVDLLILDEVLGCIDVRLLSEDKVVAFLETKPEALEVVLTGRGPSQRLIDLSDYVSEIKKIKHPYDQGIGARKGIEY